MRKPEPFKKESITVAYMIEALRSRLGIDLEQLSAADLEARLLTEVNTHRPGLVLAGYTELFTYQRAQVLGNTECRYLAWLPEAERLAAFERLIAFDVPCIFITAGNTLPAPLVEAAEARGVPLFRTTMPTVVFIARLRDYLEDQFAEQITLHGSLVDVYGIGLLITGRAGIGKSEIALDLVERGHRLVADDVVVGTRKAEGILMGSGTDLAQHFMEIRGLGLIDVRAMFGVRAIRYQKRIEVIVQMQTWDENQEYTRIGMVDQMEPILGVELPLVKLPIVPGKNVTVICEVIAMNHLLLHYGYDPAEVFARRLSERIRDRSRDGFEGRNVRRGIEWFERDVE